MKLQLTTIMVLTLAGIQLLVAGNKAQDCGPVLKLRVLDGRPVVDCVLVNGQGPFRFLVDTGSQINMLDARIAQKAGLAPTFRAETASALETIKVLGGDGIEVVLGDVKAGAQRFLFSGMEDIQKFSPDIQGVLGQEFLKHFDYLIDLQSRRLEFGKINRTGTRVQFRMTHGVPAVITSLGSLLLDSGAGQVVLFGVATDEVRRVEKTSGSTLVGLAEGKPLLIEGRMVQYDKVVTVPGRNEDVDAVGLLPARLFKAVYVCNSEGYLVLD